MRVTNVEIKNFRRSNGTFQINLDKSGKNLLVYGENGSGKSSLYLALKSFLESSEGFLTRFEDSKTSSGRMMDTSSSIFDWIRGAKEHVYEWSSR